ncbi:fatty acyl-AMP ligase [Streptomyces sp. NPDC005794]|uniref:fatty acyl-AMP ligase n=1 Tax=Streptomyces sp. NPDC005794 TaxID=3364733 RepID=UPI0036977F65
MSTPSADPLAGAHLVAAISATAQADPERKAVGFVRHPEHEGEDALRSYSWLDDKARRIAVLLRAVGLGAGSRVLLLFPQSAEFAAAYAGCLYAGMAAVPAPLPTGTSLETARVVGIARDAEAGAVLTVSDTEAEVRQWAAGTGLGDLPLFSVDELPDDADPDAWREPEIRADTVAVLQYTSGSTGSPKGVVVTHGALADNVRSFLSGFGLGAGARLGGWLPMYHDMGLFGLLSPALFSGGAAVLMSGSAFLRRPYLWLTLIDRFGLVFSAAPDFAYSYCARRVKPEEMDRLDLSRWRWAANGSEPVRAETLRAFTKEFAPAGLPPNAMTPCYGLAEATLLVSLSAGELRTRRVDVAELENHRFVEAAAGRPSREVVSCGRPPALEIRVVDPATGKPVTGDGVGEIRVQGASTARGYWQKTEATAETFVMDADGSGPWLRTGDLGALHEGELYVTGRIKELLIVHGRNIYPHDIEHELRARHAELGAVGAAFSLPTEEGEAVVVTHEVGPSVRADQGPELVTALRATLAREFGLASAGVVLVSRGRTPRTSSGKVQRRLTARLFRTGELAQVYADPGARRLMAAFREADGLRGAFPPPT